MTVKTCVDTASCSVWTFFIVRSSDFNFRNGHRVIPYDLEGDDICHHQIINEHIGSIIYLSEIHLHSFFKEVRQMPNSLATAFSGR